MSSTRVDELPNGVGRDIPVTSAGAFSRLMTSIDMTIDTKSGDVIRVNAAHSPVAPGAQNRIQQVAACS